MTTLVQLQLTTDEIPYGYCHCGCGQKTALAKRSYKSRGVVKGEPVRYVRWHTGHLHGRPTNAPTIEERFWTYVDRGAPGECWQWTAGRFSTGYGQFYADRYVVAHRFAYELLTGPIPEGLVLDHLCRNRACVNPAHLEPVTNRENILRGTGCSARNAAKTHCIHGHEFTPENTWISPSDGARGCRACHRESQRLRNARKKAAA